MFSQEWRVGTGRLRTNGSSAESHACRWDHPFNRRIVCSVPAVPSQTASLCRWVLWIESKYDKLLTGLSALLRGRR